MGLIDTQFSNDSEFNKINSFVNTWINDVANTKSALSTYINDAVSNYDTINFGSWNDEISQNLNNYCDNVKVNLQNLSSDIKDGKGKNISEALIELSSKISSCQNIKDVINDYERQKSYAKTDTLKNKLQVRIDSNTQRLTSAVSECNQILSVIPSIIYNGDFEFKKSDNSYDPDLASEDELVDQDPQGENGTFSVYEGQGDGKVQVTTYQYTDDDGETHTMYLLVNTENGNIAYGNDEMGYYYTCIAENGTVYSGFSTQYSATLDGAARVISDNHENHPNSSIFDTYSEQTYGLDKSHSDIDPSWSISPNRGTAHYATMNVGGQEVTVVIPNGDEYSTPFWPESLCTNKNQNNDDDDDGEGSSGGHGY